MSVDSEVGIAVRPLEGIKVLDLTQYLSGPYSTAMLADLGARVVKVESPRSGGDPVRSSKGDADDRGGFAFRALNRNKESVAVDLRTVGESVRTKMARWADVIVENLRPGAVEQLEFGADRIREINPSVVYASIRGYRTGGPLAGAGGFDIVAQGVAGLMEVTGHPGMPPCKVGVPIADVAAGTNLVVAVLAALQHRAATGVGMHVETSLFESSLVFAVWEAAQVWAGDDEPSRLGSAHRAFAPYQAIKVRDAHVTVAVMNDDKFGLFCEVLEIPELVDDPRFATNGARLEHRDLLIQRVERAAQGWAAEDLIERLDGLAIPAGRVNTVSEALHHPQSRAAGMVWSLDRDDGGTDQGLASAVVLDGVAPGVYRRAPRLGEHTDAFLAEIAEVDFAS